LVENNQKTLDDILANCPTDNIIGDNLVRAWSKINNPIYKKIICTISGGADSDIVLDICRRCDKDNKIDYVWFDTGLEYQATKDHLKFLENKYFINILRHKAKVPIPASCKKYGQPFISKRVSDYISRLQRHEFKWENESLDVLLKKYCVWNEKRGEWIGCRAALEWWCNAYECNRFNISNNKYLKEFIIKNPPTFKISSKCCDKAKKDVLHDVIKTNDYDLNIYGVRRAEGGNRATSYKSCFDQKNDGCDEYRPLFWYLNETKEVYKKHYHIENSKCYTEYGLPRTGCAGCPFGRDFEHELEVIKKYEPKLYTAVNNIFGDSYEYTRKYREFCKEMRNGDQ